MKIKICRESSIRFLNNKVILEYGIMGVTGNNLVELDNIAYCLQCRYFQSLNTNEIKEKLKEAHEKIKERLSTNTDIRMKSKFAFYIDINDNTIVNIKLVHETTCQELYKIFKELKEQNNKRSIDKWLWPLSYTEFNV